MSKPEVSIITICYNSGKTIRDTIQSVISQDYENIEYIIIDGASSDNTVEVVRSFSGNNIKLVSEKDKGLYDALNKGLNHSTGHIIGILHSDDFFAHSRVISDIVLMFEKSKGLDAVSSSINIYKSGRFEKPYRIYKSTSFRPWQFRLGIQPPHPGFFFKRNILESVGNFNPSYRISGDFDWLLRAIWLHKIKVLYTDYISVHMRDGGLSSSGFKSKFLLNNEIIRILKLHGKYSNKLLVYSKYFLKVFQLKI